MVACRGVSNGSERSSALRPKGYLDGDDNAKEHYPKVLVATHFPDNFQITIPVLQCHGPESINDGKTMCLVVSGSASKAAVERYNGFIIVG